MTMNSETLNALLGSIAKWQAIVDGSGGDRHSKNCALCRVFLDAHDCVGCPVNDVSKTGCVGTPYSLWIKHHATHLVVGPLKIVEGCEECRLLATTELEFLRSLLPPSPSSPRPFGLE